MYSVGDVLTTCSLSVSSKSCSQNFLIGKGRLLLQSVWSTHFPFIFLKKIVTYITLAKKGGDMICLICLFFIFKSTTNYPANVIQSLDDVKRQSRCV